MFRIITFTFLTLFGINTYASQKIEPLSDDEGYAIVAIYSKGLAERIELDGEGFANNHDFGPLNSSQYLEIVKLKAGKYQWDRVVNKIGSNGRQKFDLVDFDLTFEVQPGKLNYVGFLMFENDAYYSAKLLNRTSIILYIANQDFPQYFKQYELVNGLYPEDPYIPFFLESMNISQGDE